MSSDLLGRLILWISCLSIVSNFEAYRLYLHITYDICKARFELWEILEFFIKKCDL